MTIYKFLLHAGYSCNHFARKLGREVERIARPWKWGQPHYRPTCLLELVERVKNAVSIPVSTVAAFFGGIASILLLTTASCIGGSALEIQRSIGPDPLPLKERQLTVMSLNACFQEGAFATLTGRVSPPFEPTGKHPSRVAALAHWIGSQKLGPSQSSPDLFLGQEFHDHRAQDVFIERMRRFGYRYFALHRMSHPFWMNSGLLIASKRKIGNVSFIPYPKEDRAGVALGTLQGALTFSVLNQHDEPILRLFNTHLNYGGKGKCQAARERQLKRHVIPLFRQKKTPALLAGDFNFDTSDAAAKKNAGLKNYTNVCEGLPTCTNEGDPYLKTNEKEIETDSIDAMIPNSKAVQLSDIRIQKVTLGGSLLSDHFAVCATLNIKEFPKSVLKAYNLACNV